jgi:hypothetical protein
MERSGFGLLLSCYSCLACSVWLYLSLSLSLSRSLSLARACMSAVSVSVSVSLAVSVCARVYVCFLCASTNRGRWGNKREIRLVAFTPRKSCSMSNRCTACRCIYTHTRN